MKTNLCFIIVILFLCSCKKQTENPVPAARQTIVKDAGLIPFKIIPMADNQLKIILLRAQNRTISAVLLKIDTTTVATSTTLTNEANTNGVSATFNYPFRSGITYNFLVKANYAANDTVYQYKVQNYQHQFVKSFNYQKVLPLTQSIGPNGFDLSPSRNFLFIVDEVNNTAQLKRISLQNLHVENISTAIDLNGSPIRAASDDELLVYANLHTQVANLPAVADPGNDAAVLCRYNIPSQTASFIDYISSGYGRLSRIVNNHILVTNPIFTAKTASLINLGNLSKITYPLGNFDFTSINQNSFNHIIYQNAFLNTTDGSTSVPVNVGSNDGLIEQDDVSGYVFTGSGRQDANRLITTAFSVYKNGAPVYQSDYGYASAYFPIIYNIKNDVVTFYQSFGYDTKVNIDGYYMLNLKTKEVKLIQDDSNLFVISDYQLKNGSTISIRADGIYKLTPL